MKQFDVLSVGDVNVEITLTDLASMPVLGREILAGGLLNTIGGSTVNTAAGLARLGIRSGFVGKLGRDENGVFLRRSLADLGLDISALLYDECEPSGVTVSLSTAGDRAMVTYLGAIATLSAAELSASLLSQTKHLHVGSFFLQHALRPQLAALFHQARTLGVTTSLDTGWDDTGRWDDGLLDVLRETDLFFPNESEALAITKTADVEEAGRALSALGCTVALKTGKYGARVFTDGVPPLSHRAFRVVTRDTTGAGDAFNAGYLSGFVRGETPLSCLRRALAAGSICVSRYGSATAGPTPAETDDMLSRNELEDF